MIKVEWEVLPCLGFGPLRFGMPREECHALLGNRFQHQPEARRDRYDGGEFELDYDEMGRLEYISISADSNRIPILHGQPLLERPRQDVMRHLEGLAKMDMTYSDEHSVRYPSFQLELYQCYGSGDDFASVNIGRTGYFG